MTIDQLLNAYSKVEQMYLMRINYRNKYFTPDNWDIGHQRFVAHLIFIMNIYENELVKRFEELEDRIEEKQFTRLSLADLPSKPETQLKSQMHQLREMIPRMRSDLEKRRREAEQIWKVEIPDLIAQRRERIETAMKFFEILQSLFSEFVRNISEPETIDIYHYLISAHSIANTEHLLNPDGTINMKKIKKRTAIWIRNIYPITFEQYAKENNLLREDYPFEDNLKEFYWFAELSLFPNFIQTILDITKITRVYGILRAIYEDYTVFIPVLPNDLDPGRSSVGKAVFGYQIPSGQIDIMRIDQPINIE